LQFFAVVTTLKVHAIGRELLKEFAALKAMSDPSADGGPQRHLAQWRIANIIQASGRQKI